MVVRNCDLSDDNHEDSNGNSTGGGQDQRANTGKGTEPVRPDQRGEDDDNPSKDDGTRALEWLPMCNRKEFATELVSHLPESSQLNETDRLDNNTTHTSDYESRVVMVGSLEDLCRCDSTMGCSPEQRQGLHSIPIMPECSKDKAESLGVSRLLDGD
jgi:hypothetical protein